MSDDIADVQRTIEFRTDKSVIRSLPWALALSAVGFVMLAFPSKRGTFGGWIVLIAGIAWTFFSLSRVTRASQPVLALSPDGVLFRIPGATRALIPWHEIKRVETVDLRVRAWHGSFGSSQTIPDVTVILVPRAYYEAHLHAANPLVRGPGWRNVFSSRNNDLMQIALHHGPLSVAPKDLRRAVQVRWEAFRHTPVRPQPQSPSGLRFTTRFRRR